MGLCRSALLFAILAPCFAFATRAPISAPYKNLRHPIVDAHFVGQENSAGLPSRSDVLALIHAQSPVKDQLYRGTCSIFSSTALFESMLVISGAANPRIDLSEEWLQYLTTQTTPEEGSTSPDNFVLLRAWGQPLEKSLPYGGEAWTSKAQGLALRRCGHLPRGPKLRSCLVSHRDPDLLNMKDEELLDPNKGSYDPEFVSARHEALMARDQYMMKKDARDGVVATVSEIHTLLAAGIPLTLDLDFYYGAWNHPGGPAKGIQRSEVFWKAGTITYPEKGSIDRTGSKVDGGSHSVVVVGYDDDIEVKYWVNMKNGKRKLFTRKGVYYIKNSWGTTDWGVNFSLGGEKFPGYGMILQDNAHEFGQFFHLDL